MAIQTKSEGRCPACGEDDLHRKYPLVGAVVGALLIVVGLAAALPTLGLTFVLVLWGITLAVPRTRCTECGWERRD